MDTVSAEVKIPVIVGGTYQSYFSTALDKYQVPTLAIGKNRLKSGDGTNQGLWYVVVSLIDLSVVAQAFQPSTGVRLTTVPDAVKKYAGNSDFFLFLVTSNTVVGAVPQGDLYKFLIDTGAGPSALASVEMAFEQLGSDNLRTYSYVLAATMDKGDGKGFEAVSFNGRAVMIFNFLQITDVNKKTRYIPIRDRS
jgi:hypothetical protein